MHPNRCDAQTGEEELVVYALLGSLEAFDELVRRFRPAVVLVANQVLPSRSAAEDVAQEAFLLAFKALPQLKDRAKFAGWLCAIARHRARRIALREQQCVPFEPSKLDRLLLMHSRALAAKPEIEWERQHERDCVLEALERLPSDFRVVLHLQHYEEWAVGRIAAFLSLPITTVKWRLHRGRHLLREYLSRSEEIEP